MIMKEFKHHVQPYGTVVLKDATIENETVTGTVVSSKFCSLWCGVPIGDGTEFYEKGSIYKVKGVKDWEWKCGEKVTANCG